VKGRKALPRWIDAQNIGLAFQVQDDILDVVGILRTLANVRVPTSSLAKAPIPPFWDLSKPGKAHDLIDDARQSLMSWPRNLWIPRHWKRSRI
jgi:farnesyl diphosphate synthase